MKSWTLIPTSHHRMTPLPPLPRPVWKPARTDASFEHWTRGSIATRRRAPSRSALPLCRRQSSLAAPIVIDAQPDPIDNALARLRALFSSDNDRGNEKGKEWARKRKEEVDRSLEANKEALRSPIKYASTRKQRTYLAPRLPCVFLHGLFGFSTLSPIASLPQFSFDYWRGIVERLQQGGVEVLVTNVKTSASIEERAKDALRMIEEKFPGREVNLLGHSMGGLDARYLTSCLKGQRSFKVRSVTTIATPHRGSPFASYLLYDLIGRERLPLLLNAVQGLGIPGGGEAFENLTTEEMAKFNQRVKDEEGVMYTSWGAAFKPVSSMAFTRDAAKR